MPTSIDRASVPDQVFRRLCEDVLSGRYAPGERLPTQRRLAADLGVNIASVREAIGRLEQLRLVEVRHGDAMRVRDWRRHGGLDVMAHALAAAGGLDRGMLAAVLEARHLLLSEAARLAAERRTDESAERLTGLAERLAAAGGDDEAQALDFAFYSELVDASGNLVFTLIMNSIRELYFARAGVFSAVVEDREGLLPLYRRAAAAVAGRDAGGAADAVRELAEAQEARLMERLP